MPWDIATSIDDDMRHGLCVIAGELEGGEFDWNAMAFKEPKT